MESGNPERWMFGHHQPAEAYGKTSRQSSSESAAAPVFWPPMFPGSDAPEGVAPGRDGVHVGGEPLSSRNAAGWGAAGVGGRFGAGGRNGGYAAPAQGGRDSGDVGRDGDRHAGPAGDAGALAGPVAMLRRDDGQRGSGSGFALLEGNGTIPEIASDAALAELQARIREDVVALKQFRVETQEQQQHVSALRKELEDLHLTLNTLSAQRMQAGSEVEEEERRISDARRLRSSLRKGLHDAQKRVDGMGHRSRAALRQLQRLLGQASQFVAVEEESANGGPPLPHGDAPGTPPDAEDCMSDRYSVVDQETAPAAPQGPLDQLFSWARSVLSIRFALSFSEVSLTLSPGPRRRRKRHTRPRAPRSALREIMEMPDLGDDEGVEPGSPLEELPPDAAPPVPPLQLPPAGAASATDGDKPPPPRSSMTMTGSSVHELSKRLAQREKDGGRPGAAGAAARQPTVGGPSDSNRFARLVSIAGQNAAAAQQPAFMPARAAPPPPPQRGALTPQPRQQQSRDRGDAAAVSWPLTPLSPQNSAERLDRP